MHTTAPVARLGTFDAHDCTCSQARHTPVSGKGACPTFPSKRPDVGAEDRELPEVHFEVGLDGRPAALVKLCGAPGLPHAAVPLVGVVQRLHAHMLLAACIDGYGRVGGGVARISPFVWSYKCVQLYIRGYAACMACMHTCLQCAHGHMATYTACAISHVPALIA